jgi:ABC-type multidrug transport system fused ATPase/permease subunit
MDAIEKGTTTEFARFIEAQTRYQDQVRESTTVQIFQDCLPITLFYVGFFVMAAWSTAQHTDLRARNFTVLIITYMIQLQGQLKSLSTTVRKFLDLVVNFERIFDMLKGESHIIGPDGVQRMAHDLKSLPAAYPEPMTALCMPEAATDAAHVAGQESEQPSGFLPRIHELHHEPFKSNGLPIYQNTVESIRRGFWFIPNTIS